MARTAGERARKEVDAGTAGDVRVLLVGVRQVGVDQLHGVHQQVAGDQQALVGRLQQHRLVAGG